MNDTLIQTLRTDRLLLEPLQAEHADELFPLLDDQRLHTFTGGTPAALDALRARYTSLTSRRSPDGSEIWLNWIVRRHRDGTPVGRLEATVSARSAWVAWVIGTEWQARGYASEASTAVVRWLLERYDVDMIAAHIHPAHRASERVAAHAGLTVTDQVVDGERVWRLLSREITAR